MSVRRSMALDWLYLTERDLTEFSQKLLDEFPNVRFIDQDITSSRKNRTLMTTNARGQLRNLDVRRPRPPHRGEAVRLFRRLPFYHTVIEAWNILPQWRPRWAYRRGLRGLYLANAPITRLRLCVSVDVVSSDQDYPEDRRVWELNPSFLNGFWKPGHDPGRRFVQRAFRILESICTTEFVRLNKDTLLPLENSRGGIAYFRAGRDATVWVNRNPKHYFRGYLRSIWIEKRARVMRKTTDTRVKN